MSADFCVSAAEADRRGARAQDEQCRPLHQLHPSLGGFMLSWEPGRQTQTLLSDSGERQVTPCCVPSLPK